MGSLGANEKHLNCPEAIRARILSKACSGMFSDELDQMGLRNQVITGLVMNRNGKIYGKARTILLETRKTRDENIAKGLGFFEKLRPGEILCVQGSPEFAYFGELMSRLAVRQKLGGVVIGGLTRDSAYTRDLEELVIFAEGYSPRDIKGRGSVKETDAAITIKGIPIHPGDYLFGDGDGLVVIPSIYHAEVEACVKNKIAEEERIIEAISQGLSVRKILELYREF